MPDDELTRPDARERLAPVLPESPLFSPRQSPSSGWGVYASQNLVKGTQLFECSNLAASVVYRALRKEVCAWCLRYEDGRLWKWHAEKCTDGKPVQNLGVVIFCSLECRDFWTKSVGEIGIDAYDVVEEFVRRRSRASAWADSGSESVEIIIDAPSAERVDKAEIQGQLIRELRSGSDALNSKTKAGSKQMRKAMGAALASRVPDTDTLYLSLSGILLRQSAGWERLLMLNPTYDKLYTSITSLDCMTTTYLQLLAVLPPPLLESTTRETIEAVIARDIGNSFGIWSICGPEESPEMLGYGMWPEASFFNHSCSANVSRRRMGRTWVFELADDVPAGSELCISYIRGEEDSLPPHDRRERLRSGWGFLCACSRCDMELAQEN